MPLDTNVSELTQKLNELPTGARALIYSTEVDNILLSIGSGHNLHVDQIGDLKSQVLFLVAGITPREEFIKKLMRRLEIEDETRVQAIAQDVETMILVPIREKMKTLKPTGGEVSSPAIPEPIQTIPLVTTPYQSTPESVQQAQTTTATPSIVANTAPIPVTPAAPASVAPKPVSTLGSPLDSAMAKPQTLPITRVDVGIAAPAPAKPIYKVDPYRELPQ